MIKIRQVGFTLIEMLIAVVILAIVLASAAPSFMRTIDNNRITGAANDFSASLAFAKSEAVKRSSGVKLVASGGDWDDGYSITDANDVVLKIVDQPHGMVSISSALTTIEFNMLGGTANAGSLVFDISCADFDRDACARTITITASGVFTMEKETGSCECP